MADKNHLDPIELRSLEYVVTDILRNSKARYAKDVKPGDIIQFSMKMVDVGGASRGNYATDITVFHNGVQKCTDSQTIIQKTFYSTQRFLNMDIK